jgi:hypothetical protein
MLYVVRHTDPADRLMIVCSGTVGIFLPNQVRVGLGRGGVERQLEGIADIATLRSASSTVPEPCAAQPSCAHPRRGFPPVYSAPSNPLPLLPSFAQPAQR